MPNLSKIYSDATHVVKEKPKENISPAEEASRIQAKINWLESSITEEMIKDISSEINALRFRAEQLAISYPTHQNHHEIIQLLVRAVELKKLINKYATT